MSNNILTGIPDRKFSLAEIDELIDSMGAISIVDYVHNENESYEDFCKKLIFNITKGIAATSCGTIATYRSLIDLTRIAKYYYPVEAKYETVVYNCLFKGEVPIGKVGGQYCNDIQRYTVAWGLYFFISEQTYPTETGWTLIEIDQYITKIKQKTT